MIGRLPRAAALLARLRPSAGLIENHAVTVELLARPRPPRPPIVTAVQSWIGFRRLAWLEVEAGRISGVATARSIGSRDAWEIDMLLGARRAVPEDGAAFGRLLRRVADAASSERVGHVILRTPAGGVAVGAALRAGFQHASTERLWAGPGLSARPEPGVAAVVVRELRAGDDSELFRLYSAATPVAARRAFGLTLSEWRALDGSRWTGRRGGRWVAEVGGRPVAAARVSTRGALGELELLVEPPSAEGPAPQAADRGVREGGRTLLQRAAEATARCARVVSLVPRSAVVVEELLGAHGLTPGGDVELLAIRTRQPAVDPARRGAGVVVASGG